MKSILLPSLVLLLSISFTKAADLPSGFVEEVLAEGIDPVKIAITSDKRVFIAEKNGTIRVYANGKLQEDPFLELIVDNYNERGLQNIILDPEFELNNYVYVFYTSIQGFNKVVRYTASGNYALPGSEKTLINLDPISGSIHNGGAMVFGKDQKLYIGTGESGNTDHSQNLNSLLGKVLRINKDGSIPTDNPFYNDLDGKDKAIYAYGFRNPFSMAVNPTTGTILVTDVGDKKYEEVNRLSAGKNYGWPKVEGDLKPGQDAPENYQDPLFSYPHDGRCAVVGSAFYEPKELKSFPTNYWGKFFFGDYCSGKIYFLDETSGELKGIFATGVNRLVAIEVSDNGDLYYLQRAGIGSGSIEDNTGTKNGSLIKVSYTGSGEPFISLQPKDQLVPIGEDAEFSVYASGDKPLNYEWKVNGTIKGTNSNTIILEEVDLSLNNAEITVSISNEHGKVSSKTAFLSVSNNQRPEAVIDTPENNQKYKGGDTLFLSGTGTDPEDGELAEENLSWHIDFHHDDHTHPAMLPTTGKTTQYIIPTMGETAHTVWYRIYLTATDHEGLPKTVYKEVQPYTSSFTVKTEPAGAELKLEGKSFSGDTTVTSVVNLTRAVQAEPYTIKGDSIYVFIKWSNNSTNPVQLFSVPEKDTVIKAYFSATKVGDKNNSFIIFPNPVKNNIRVVGTEEQVITRLEILNSQGVTVYTDRFWSKTKDIDLSTLPAGLYIIQITEENNVTEKRILKK